MKLTTDVIRDLARFYVSRRKLDKFESLDFDVRENGEKLELGARYMRSNRFGDRKPETIRKARIELELAGAIAEGDEGRVVDVIREAARYLVLQVAPSKPPAFRIRPPHFARRRALAILRGL